MIKIKIIYSIDLISEIKKVIQIFKYTILLQINIIYKYLVN